MLAMPGWKTVCVQVPDYDGEKLAEASLRALFEEVTGPYVRDRHENP